MPRRRRLPRRAPAAQRLRPARRPGRGVWRCEPRRPGAGAAIDGLPVAPADRPVDGRRSSPSPTARSGWPRAGPRRARRGRSCCAGPGRRRRDGGPRPRRPAGADLPAHRHRRGDGRRAAPGGVQPQHQGAGRLLGGAVHRRGGDARAGRAHPRAPRVDARERAGGDRRLRRPGPAGRPGRGQRPLRRGDAPQRRHPRRSLLRRRPARGVGGEPGPPRGRRRRRTRLDPGRRRRDPPGGPAHPAHPARRRRAPAAGGQLPHAGGAPRRPRRPDRRQRRGRAPGRVVAGGAPLDEVVDYGERRMRAALRDRPTARGGSRTCSLDRRRRPAAPRPHRRGHRGRRRGDRRLHRTDPQARGTSTRSRRHARRFLRPALGDRPDPAGQRRGDAAGAGRGATGHDRRRRPPAAVGAGNVEEPAGGRRGARRWRSLRRPGAGRRPGR